MPSHSADVARWLANDDAAPSAPPCSYLFHKWDRMRRGHTVEEHSHHFWQLEYVVEGLLNFTVCGHRYELRPGMGIVVPQELLHHITYDDRVNRALTVKFNVDSRTSSTGPLRVLATTRHRTLLEALAAQLPPELPREEIPATVMATVAGVLGACVAAAIADDDAIRERHSGSSLVAVLRRQVLRNNGAAMAVKDLARQIGLSPSHLTARFRSETGQGLKSYIDEQRAIIAARQLAFTDKSIGQISDDLGFCDSFTFSRFFRRVVQMTPSDFRRAAWSQLQ